MSKKKPDYYRAKESFVTVFEGDQISVAAGELVRAGHPLLKRREELFAPVEDFGRFDRPEVEQATAAPGEKRGEQAAKAEPEPKPSKGDKS